MSKGPHSQFRRAARTAAVQALYQLDMSEDLSGTVIKQFVEHRFAVEDSAPSVDADFFEDVVEGVIKFQDDIDDAISQTLSEKWSLKRLDLTLRAILRAGAYEIQRRPDIPALVIIDQYVSISADFFEGKERGFVNGALDKIAKGVRKAEFGIIAPSIGHE